MGYEKARQIKLNGDILRLLAKNICKSRGGGENRKAREEKGKETARACTP